MAAQLFIYYVPREKNVKQYIGSNNGILRDMNVIVCNVIDKIGSEAVICLI